MTDRPASDGRQETAGSPSPGLPARLVGWVESLISGVAQLILVSTTLVIFTSLLVHVILRYAFDGGIPGTHELAQLLFPWLVMAGGVLASLRGRQIAVDVLLRALPARGRLALVLVIHAIVLGLGVAVVWAAVNMAVSVHDQTTPVLSIPNSYGYASLIYGFACIAVLAVTQSYRAATDGFVRGQSLA